MGTEVKTAKQNLRRLLKKRRAKLNCKKLLLLKNKRKMPHKLPYNKLRMMLQQKVEKQLKKDLAAAEQQETEKKEKEVRQKAADAAEAVRKREVADEGKVKAAKK